MIEPGDLVLAHSKGAFATLIRFGQWLRPSWRPGRKWNHAAIVVSVEGEKIECVQMGRHGERVPIAEVAPHGYYTTRKIPQSVDSLRAVCYALEQVGIDYSVATIVSIALNLLTPKWMHIDFRRDGDALICSALVARSWEHGGWDCPTNPLDITPAELAILTA